MASDQPTPQLLKRRWQQKNADGFRLLPAHLAVALHVDIQQNISAGLPCLGQLTPRGSVIIAVDLCPLHKLASGDHSFELGNGNEEIILSFPLTSPAGTGGIRDRKFKPARGSQEPPNNG